MTFVLVVLVLLTLRAAYLGVTGLAAMRHGGASGAFDGWRGFFVVFLLCGIPPLATALGLPLARALGATSLALSSLAAVAGMRQRRAVRSA